MPIEAVKIPQNVYIEDRIIGPLSLRQIIIIAIGGGISYAMFGSLQKALGAVPLPLAIIVWIPAVIAAIFAMIRINDLSISRILLLLLESTQKPSKRMWAPRPGISINFRMNATPVHEEKPKKKAAPAVRPETQFQELSSTMDNLWHADPVAPIQTTAATPASATPAVTDAQPQIETPQFTLPINGATEQKPSKAAGLSDLSVFRDLFPPSTPPHGSAA